jgi:hypothetical protein
VTAEIHALEICQVFMKNSVLKRMEHLENSDEETHIKMDKRGKNGKWKS